MVTLLLSIFAGIVVAFVYENVMKYLGKSIFNKHAFIIKDYKLHHSLYGLICFAIYAGTNNEFYLGIGLGIIIQHTFTDGFKFIEKI